MTDPNVYRKLNCNLQCYNIKADMDLRVQGDTTMTSTTTTSLTSDEVNSDKIVTTAIRSNTLDFFAVTPEPVGHIMTGTTFPQIIGTFTTPDIPCLSISAIMMVSATAFSTAGGVRAYVVYWDYTLDNVNWVTQHGYQMVLSFPVNQHVYLTRPYCGNLKPNVKYRCRLESANAIEINTSDYAYAYVQLVGCKYA